MICYLHYNQLYHIWYRRPVEKEAKINLYSDDLISRPLFCSVNIERINRLDSIYFTMQTWPLYNPWRDGWSLRLVNLKIRTWGLGKSAMDFNLVFETTYSNIRSRRMICECWSSFYLCFICTEFKVIIWYFKYNYTFYRFTCNYEQIIIRMV